MVKVKIIEIEWDEYNIDHIARHEVITSEVEEVCKNDVIKLKSESHPTRIVLIGRTSAKRMLRIVLEPKEKNIWRTVTAHNASRKDRKLYKKIIGGEEI